MTNEHYYGPTLERYPGRPEIRALNLDNGFGFHEASGNDALDDPPDELLDLFGEPDDSTPADQLPCLPWLASVDGSGNDSAASLLRQVEMEMEYVPGTSLLDAVKAVLTTLQPSAESAAESLAGLSQAGLRKVLRPPPVGVQPWDLLALISIELKDYERLPDWPRARAQFFKAARECLWWWRGALIERERDTAALVA